MKITLSIGLLRDHERSGDQNSRSLNNGRESAACKMDIVLDKDDKPQVPSHKPSMFITLWEVKEPTHFSQRVGNGAPGVVVCSL